MQVPYAIVKLARSSDRPTGMDYIHNLFTDYVELHGDRRSLLRASFTMA